MRLSRSAPLCALLLLSASAPAQTASTGTGQAYPSRPIRLIVPQGAGGSTDIISRITAQRMSVNMNQQIVIDNRTGAGTPETHARYLASELKKWSKVVADIGVKVD